MMVLLQPEAFHSNPSNSYWDISIWTKVVDRLIIWRAPSFVWLEKTVAFFYLNYCACLSVCVSQGWDDPDVRAVPVCASCSQLVWETTVSHFWGVEWAPYSHTQTETHHCTLYRLWWYAPLYLASSQSHPLTSSYHVNLSTQDRIAQTGLNGWHEFCAYCMSLSRTNIGVRIWDSPQKSRNNPSPHSWHHFICSAEVVKTSFNT